MYGYHTVTSCVLYCYLTQTMESAGQSNVLIPWWSVIKPLNCGWVFFNLCSINVTLAHTNYGYTTDYKVIFHTCTPVIFLIHTSSSQHAFQLCVKVWEVVTMCACVNGDYSESMLVCARGNIDRAKIKKTLTHNLMAWWRSITESVRCSDLHFPLSVSNSSTVHKRSQYDSRTWWVCMCDTQRWWTKVRERERERERERWQGNVYRHSTHHTTILIWWC